MAVALRFAVEMLRMLSGLLIWGSHFLFIYIFTALACARRFYDLDWLGIGIVPWAIALAAVAALGGILSILRPAWRNIRRRPEYATPVFIDWMTVAFGGLGLIAIVLESLPVMLVPICG
jgi:hypothetical protein